MEESFCRSDPAAEFLGLTKRRSPASDCRRLSSAKADTGMYTSPRTSMTSGAGSTAADNRSGMSAMVATLAVTSSPVLPSPRVAAWTNLPCR